MFEQYRQVFHSENNKKSKFKTFKYNKLFSLIFNINIYLKKKNC
jgi:hypothetical protein